MQQVKLSWRTKMFSEIFFKQDRYNLDSGEYISTIERMPWRYTGLVDSAYLPTFSGSLSAKLNKVYQYKYPHLDVAIMSDYKVVGIEYVGDEIKSYCMNTMMHWSNLTEVKQVWDTFLSFCDLGDLSQVKETVDKMTDETDFYETLVQGFHYDADGNCTGIRIYDPTYNLDEYSSNELLVKMNKLCKEKKSLRGTFDIFLDGSFSFNLAIAHPQVSLEPQERGNIKEAHHEAEYRNRILPVLVEAGLITEDHKSVIEAKCTGTSVFDLEYKLSSAGEITETIFKHLTHVEFRDLTAS